LTVPKFKVSCHPKNISIILGPYGIDSAKDTIQQLHSQFFHVEIEVAGVMSSV